MSAERATRRWRDLFERAVVSKAKQWTFEAGEIIDGQRVGSTFMLPVQFTITDSRHRTSQAGWRAFVPGPIVPAPWMSKPQDDQRINELQEGQTLALSSQVRLVSEIE